MGWFLITRFTLQEAVRRRLFIAVALLTLLLLGVFALLLKATIASVLCSSCTSSLGFRSSGTNSLGWTHSADPQTLLLINGIIISLLSVWIVYLLSSALAIFLTVGVISGEIEAGTLAVIVPKPLRRSEIVFGKWLAYALIVGLYTAVLFFAFLLLIHWQTGYWPSQALSALAMLELGIFALIGLTTLGSTLLPTSVNGAIALILFIGAPLTSIVQFLTSMQSQPVQNITTIIDLVIPTDALWHGAAFYLLPPSVLTVLGGDVQSLSVPFLAAQPVSLVFLVWVVLYCVFLPLAGAWRFQHRDL